MKKGKEVFNCRKLSICRNDRSLPGVYAGVKMDPGWHQLVKFLLETFTQGIPDLTNFGILQCRFLYSGVGEDGGLDLSPCLLDFAEGQSWAHKTQNEPHCSWTEYSRNLLHHHPPT